MASLPFASDPLTEQLDAEARGLRARGIVLPGEQAPKKVDAKAAFEELARQTRVPVNVLMALAEKDGATKPEDAIAAATKHAQALAGKDLQTALGAHLGDTAATDAVLDRADRIAKALYPDQAASVTLKKGERGATGAASDLSRSAAGGITTGIGSAVRGAGNVADTALTTGGRRDGDFTLTEGPDGQVGLKFNGATPAPDAGQPGTLVGRSLRGVGDWITGRGEATLDRRSPEAQAAIAGSTPAGDITKPGTWSFGDDPTVEGYVNLATEALGSMAPVVLGSIATGGATAGAVIGGMQSGGAASQQAEAQIDAWAKEPGRLAKESPLYGKLIAGGATPQQALDQTKTAAREATTTLAGIVGAAGGAATGRIVQGPVGALAGRSLPTRVLGTGALSAAEEGTQEAAETVAGRAAMNTAIGSDESLTEGTFGDAVLGALAGGPVGAAGGARGGQEPPAAEPPASAPQPPAGPPSAPGAPEAPVAPKGRLERALEAATPEAEAIARGPIFPDAKPGGTVTVTDAESGESFEGTFAGETPEGIAVNIAGAEIVLPRADVQSGAVMVEGLQGKEGTAVAPKPRAEHSENYSQAMPASGQALETTPQSATENGTRPHAPGEPPLTLGTGDRVIDGEAQEVAPPAVLDTPVEPGSTPPVEPSLAAPGTPRSLPAPTPETGGTSPAVPPQDAASLKDAPDETTLRDHADGSGRSRAVGTTGGDNPRAAQGRGQLSLPAPDARPALAGPVAGDQRSLPQGVAGDAAPADLDLPVGGRADGDVQRSDDGDDAGGVPDARPGDDLGARVRGDLGGGALGQRPDAAGDAGDGGAAGARAADGAGPVQQGGELSDWRVDPYEQGDETSRWRVGRNNADSRADVWGHYATRKEAEAARAYAEKDTALRAAYKAAFGKEPSSRARHEALDARLKQNGTPFAAAPTDQATAPQQPQAEAPAAPPADQATVKQPTVRPIRTDKAITARGREIPVEYAIAELDDLIPSQLDDGRDNPAYPQALQPRDRSGNRSQEQVRKIAADLKPELLGESPQAGAGAPIVGADGYVESGNGRTLALRRAYADGNADGYRQYLASKGYPVDGMRQPVLVRVRQGDASMEERAATAREANERDTQAMSVSEQGMADSATMTASVLDLYRGGDIDAASNRDFVRGFLGKVVAPADMGALVRDDGSMTQDAVRRVQAALLARAYGDPDLIGSIMESTETSIKAIGGAMTDAAARWAQMRDAAKDGAIAPDMDQTPALMEAVRIVDRARRAGRKVDEFVGQTDMFAGDAVSPMGKTFLALMFNDAPKSYGRPAGRDRMADDLLRYVTEAMKTQPGIDMLGQLADPAATLATIKGKRDGAGDTGQAGLFGGRDAGDDARAGGEQPPAGTPRGPRGEAGDGRPDQAATGAGQAEGLTPKPKRAPKAQPAPQKSGPGYIKAAKATTGAKAKDRLRADAIRDFFTPGNIVASYGGFADRVLAFDPDTRTVRVQSLKRQGDAWVDDKDRGIRTHGTMPDARALEQGPLERAEVKEQRGAEPAFTPAAARRVAAAARQRLAALTGTDTAVRVETAPRPGVKGSAQPGLVKLFRTDAGWRHTLDHEAVHILRGIDAITAAEWKALVAAARRDADLMVRVAKAYPDLTPLARMEEAVAEMFADWRTRQEASGPVQRAFERVASVFRALASALRGEGFIDGAMAMQRIADGTVGGRGPGGGQPRDAQGRFVAEQRAFHGSPHDFDRFTTAAMGTGEGAQAFGYGMYFASRREIAEHYRDALSGRGLIGAKDIHRPAGLTDAEFSDVSAALGRFWGMWDQDDMLREIRKAKGEAEQSRKYLAHLEAQKAETDPDLLAEFPNIFAKRDAEIASTRKAVEEYEQTARAADLIQKHGIDAFTKKGRLYTVEVPDDADLLDWDAPLSKQPAKVKAALKKVVPWVDDTDAASVWVETDRWGAVADQFGAMVLDVGTKPGTAFRALLPYAAGPNGRVIGEYASQDEAKAAAQAARRRHAPAMTGAQIYEHVVALGAKAIERAEWFQTASRYASEALAAAGIPGHRYLDGGSRADGDGSRNYVIYADEHVEVAAKEQRTMDAPASERALTRRFLDAAARGAKATGRDAATMARDAAGFAKRLPGEIRKRGTREGLSFALTDAMALGGGQSSILGLVPGRALFTELGKALPSARIYLREKDAMDALRNRWHARADDVAQDWRKLLGDRDTNTRLMDLMLDATLEGVDPSRPFAPQADDRMRKMAADPNASGKQRAMAAETIARDKARSAAHAKLSRAWDSLPAEYQAMFRRVRDEYGAMADAHEEAIIAHVEQSMKAAARQAKDDHEKRLREIEDEGLTGEAKAAAIKDAGDKLTRARARAVLQTRAKTSALRLKFETNRLQGPYFPLARHGDFFVTARDEQGQVVSFSLFETARAQKEWADQIAAEGYDVKVGALSNAKQLREAVPGGFVAEIEAMLGEAGVAGEVLDRVWQRYLETLPDMSMRKNRIHRKGTAGFNRDAFRAFGKQMFHGAHQLARLKHGVPMSEALAEMEKEAASAPDPVRAGLVVNEMNRRHAFTLNPTGGSLAQAATSAAFVWYLAMSPAAAMVNISQTTVVGIPILRAAFRKAGTAGASRELARAMGDFTRGVGWAERSKRLTADERTAMQEGYDLGVIDKSQAHDLAGVGETGVEYSDVRARWMAKMSWFFHHAERLNREVTYLAAYRLARAEGADHAAAIEKAGDLTWKSHFDYGNTSRPRVMQGDAAKVLLTFRNYSVNVLWRLFRDSHQAMMAENPEDQAEARAQLLGITASMMIHAGIKGTWGYGLLMTLAAMFLPGDSDDLEEGLKKALLGGADDTGAVAGMRQWVGGMLLNGMPGHLTGTSLSERIGMGSLWFRDDGRIREGEEAYLALIDQIAGPAVGMLKTPFTVGHAVSEGQYQRAFEMAVPKWVRDPLKAGRYATEGVTTWKGDDIVPDVSAMQIIAQASGFTPAQVAERYEANSRMMNKQERITGERSGIQKAAGDAIMAGKPIPGKVLEKIAGFNRRYPEYPITRDTLKQSVGGRIRARERNEFGVALQPKLNARIRGEQAAMAYD